MGYTNETLHYGIPKPLGTDLTVPQDYNDAADAVDQALFDAASNATEAITAANNAVEAAAEAVEDVGDLGTEVNSLKARTSALEATEIVQNNKIDNLENQGVTKFDSAGIADPYVNGLTYSVGDVVTYNGQRYKCITAVVAAEPFDADKWSAEDVETVLDELKSDLIGYGQGHNAIYRGKNLGTITSSNLSTFLTTHGITDGTFTDLYLGDYFIIQDGTYNAEWMVAGFNTHKNKGNSNIITGNHIAIIPRTVLFNDKMNSDNVTTGGYKGSYMHTTVMSTVTTRLNSVLGSHLLTRDALITNNVDTTNKSSAYTAWEGASYDWEWVATRCELMTETEVYGAPIFSSSAYDQGEGCMKLPVFNFINHIQFARATFWLRSVTNSTSFCDAYGHGIASYDSASISRGVRPLALLG